MLRFEINHTSSEASINEVLIDIPLGKSYITNQNYLKKQSAQKSGTCWYYVLNYLRVRYGKDFIPQEYPARQDEAILSFYRKKTTEIDNHAVFLTQLLESLQL